jgi:hypothetical protein
MEREENIRHPLMEQRLSRKGQALLKLRFDEFRRYH